MLPQRVSPRMRPQGSSIPGMSEKLFVSLARLVLLVTAIATAAPFVVPVLAIATGAYPSMPMDAGSVSRLLSFFLAEALSVGLVIGVPTAVFLVCRRERVMRRAYATVGASAIAGALLTAALSVWVVPSTNASYRRLAFGDAAGRLVNGRRLNEPGEPGDRFQTRQRWALPESVLVFTALAILASRAAHRRSGELT